MKPQIKPTPKQYQCWQLLQDHKSSYILYGGGAGAGKSYLSAQWLFVMATSFPNTRYFIARSELKLIRSSWLQTFHKVIRDMGLNPLDQFKYNAMDSYIQFENGSRIDLLDLHDEPSDPFFERLGSYEFTSGCIEEASEVSESAFDMLKSRVGRCMNEEYKLDPKILLSCNPRKNWLYHSFYKPYVNNELPEGYAVVLATVKDNPYMKDYEKQLHQITDVGQRERLLGNWEYLEESRGLIEYQAILDSFSGLVNSKVKRSGEYFISADISRYGSDSVAISLWSGNRCERISTYQKLSIPEVVEKILNLKSEFNVPVSNVVVDSDGVGGGVADAMPGCVNFINNAVPIEIDGKRPNVVNLKTQCYMKLAEKLNEREIYISCDLPSLRADLIQELEQVKLKDSEGKLAIISKSDIKKQIGRSPDLSDALMMKMIFELKPPTSDPIFYVFSDEPTRPFEPDQSRVDYSVYSQFKPNNI